MANLMKTLNSSYTTELDVMNALLTVSPGVSNAVSDRPSVWCASDPQPFTAIWGCKTIVPQEEIRTISFF